MSTGAQQSPIADPNDSLLGWASQTELRLASTLKDNDWFTEAGLGHDECEAIEKFYGTFLGRQLDFGADFSVLIASTPALTVTTLVYRASRMVEAESLFTEYFGGLGIVGTEGASEDYLRENISGLVAKVGLTTIPDCDPITLLTLHAGITSDEVPTLLEAMDAAEDSSDNAGITAECPQLTAGADVAPQRVEEIIEAVRGLRQHTVDHPGTWQMEDDTEAPILVQEKVFAELAERPVGTENRRDAVGAGHREERPRLVLNLEQGKVCVRLPEQILDPGDNVISWRVSVGGTTEVFRTNRPWGSTRNLTESLDLTLRHQVREIQVADVTNQHTWVVPVVNNDDPLLVFSTRGQNLTAKQSLHHGELACVCPADGTLIDVVTGKELPVEEVFDVEGWNGWEGRILDCSSADSIQLLRSGEAPSPMKAVRSIDPRQRVVFTEPEGILPDVHSSTDLPVHTESLVVEFPPTQSGTTEQWYLTISAYAGADQQGTEIAPTEPLEVPAEGGIFDVFDPEVYDAPWVGEFLVRIRGPRGESFRHEYALVEGATAFVEGSGPSLRIPAKGGLSTASLHVQPGEKDFDVTPQVVDVAPEEAGAFFTVETDEGTTMPMRFFPSRLRFQLPIKECGPIWRTTRIVTPAADIDTTGRIRVRATGEIGKPQVTVRNRTGAPVRTLNLNPEDMRTYSAELSPLGTGLVGVNGGRIEFEWTDPGTDRRVSVNIAILDSTPVATGAEIHGSTLELIDFAAQTINETPRQLAAWVWPDTAPWVNAVTLPVEDGKVELPESYQQTGQLSVYLHTPDPFNTVRPPLTPPSTSLTVTQEGHFPSSHPGFDELSAFLAGETDNPPADPSIMPVLWDSAITEGVSRKAIVSVFTAHPAAALAGLSASLIPAEKQPSRIIASGLITSLFNNGEVATEMHRAPWIGALQLIGQLRASIAVDTAADGDDEATQEEAEAPAVGAETQVLDPKEKKKVIARLKEVGGKRLVETLATGRDATLDTACVDKGIVQISHMDPAQQETLLSMFFSSAEIVPGPILEDSTRLLAVYETFKHREELNVLLADQQMIKAAVALLRGLRGANRQLYTSARIRFDKLDGVDTENRDNVWALAPVVSLVFALAARMHAYGLIGKSKQLTQASRGWAKLATIVPELVTGDIVSAEAMVCAVTYPGIVG
ncbi:hypothetical protein [Corynebacterium glucuronolyticum]|uniref:hypothetical protein n=1 Tax=Corynebacterium glucuronolyticum TaxID=39791 RepID=UPI00019C23B7|nr:hypothetical protein [Corynebacterium glucuronolyticum]EEI26806.1 hypothetical protein HMPREF0294_1750 [Corynebacterium glucuronolyticum ATCC 51867]QRO82984.1 hypothetical protein I6J20_02095 [Corynebacterium glucuronolyticum]